MAKARRFKNAMLSAMLMLMMVFTMVAPSITVEAANDTIDVGEPAYNAVSGIMQYSNCLGTGSTLYKSIVISFTSVRENGECAVMPAIDGFTVESKLSTDGTYVINMNSGKNLVQVASFIRKIQFKNCQNSSQKINFSIGRDLVEYMTFYSEDTGHYYQFVPFIYTMTAGPTKQDASGKTWQYGTWPHSYYSALDMTYEGLQGYLCTISSLQEDFFVYQCSGEIGWLGGTRMKHGDLLSKNGISYYSTFTPPTSESDNGLGYWYWSCGPDLDIDNGSWAPGEFLSAVKGSNTLFATAKKHSPSWYNNWNTGEPNNSNNEYVMTTLKIGSGYETSGTSGAITSSSPYYKSSGYSWNDIVHTNMAKYGSSAVNSYTATGFFVEYGDLQTGLSTDAKNAKTNFEFKTETSPLTHNWALYAPTNGDTMYMYCTLTDPKCSYYAASSKSLGNTITATITTPNMPYDGSTYSLATVEGKADIVAAAPRTGFDNINYYQATRPGQVTGGTSLGTTAPKDVGYYYASVAAGIQNVDASGNLTNTTTATIVSPFRIYDSTADYDIDSLSNLEVSDPEDAAFTTYTTKVVQGSTDTADLQVVLATPGDHIDMYQIASMDWDEEGNLQDMAWIDQVQAWIDANPNYRNIASTPDKMSNGQVSSSTISAFYKDMLKAEGTNVITINEGTEDALVDITKADNHDGKYSSSQEIYVDGSGAQVDANAEGAYLYAYKYKDMKFGIYAIMATDAGYNPYSVTVAAVFPQQSGPKGSFFIQELFTVYIKEVEATIEKTINGEKEDSLEIGEAATFSIDFGLPQYKDRVTSGTGSGYTLYFEDKLAKGYTIDESSIKLYYIYGADETEEIDLDNIPTANVYRFGNTGDIELTNANANEAIVDYSTILTRNTDLIGKYATLRENVPIFDGISVDAQETSDTTIRINFDEPAVRAWKYSLSTGSPSRSLSGFRITYDAVLDKDAVINSDQNYNTAYLYYEKDSTGVDTVSMHDTVYGYTYAVNIVKIDGSADETTYLAGAKFKLFKENTELEATDEIEGNNEDYYVYTTTVNDAEVKRVFEKVSLNNGVFVEDDIAGTTDTLVSVATAQGLMCHGLKEGNYILVETEAPRGYNELAEDIYFEINRLNANEELIKGGGSLKWFREMPADGTTYDEEDPETAVINENAAILLDVYNYQGLTLPSTGGMGILLFIIIGTSMMAGVIAIIIVRRKTMANF